jgi:creatinine amidohydrolase/Fe(II)-dependent formamide hydrolase-like protein
MRMAGTITLPNDRFMALLEHAARSLEAGGFREILFLGDSGGNQDGMRDVAAKLDAEWAATGARARFIGDYYAKSMADAERYVRELTGNPEENVAGHAGLSDTAQMMAVNMAHVRTDRMVAGGGFQGSGVSGDPTKGSAELGRRILQFKIDNAVAQIRALRAERRDLP